MDIDPHVPSLDRVRALLDSMSGLPVLVLGDLMLDVYLSGRVERISPEGPVPVIEVESSEQRLGGAANVARNVAALGGRPRLLALRGQDAAGVELDEILAQLDIAATDLVVDPTRPTTVKTRILGAGQQICRYDSEARDPAAGAVLAEVERRALDALGEVRAVVLSDYGKGVLVDALVETVVAAARERGVPVIVDPKEGHFAAYRGVDLVTPNKAEAAASYGLPIRTEAELERVGSGLLERLDLRALMITLGEGGIALFEGQGPSRRFPAKARQVFDVTGAGDTVVATLALTLAAGGSLDEGAALANHAAGLVVAEIGTAAVAPAQLLASFLDELLPEAEPGEDGLVLERAAATEWAERARSQGKRVVFTNGCFDILHFGHHALLADAASQGDLLLVGLNGDASVKRLKGDSRPVNGEAERARLLAHLRSVDAVCVFDEDTPLELIRATRPDVLVKGAEYEETAIVGAEDVLAWGGHVHRFPMQQGYSTTMMIEKERRARGSKG